MGVRNALPLAPQSHDRPRRRAARCATAFSPEPDRRETTMLNPAAPFLTALRQRNLRVLFAGLVASQAGDWLYNLALLAFVYERTGSSAWVGITTAARIVPEVVL